MYAVTTPTILFYYKTADLVDRLQMYSGHTVRPLADNEKSPVKIEELALTDDDMKLIYAECDRAITKIFQQAYKLTHSLIDALLKNHTLVINTVDTDVYGFYIINKAAYNPNLVDILDTAIEELLVSMVLTKWFTITRQFDLLKAEGETLAGLQVAYNNALTEFYKPKVQSLDVLPIFTNEVITVDPETGNTTEIVVIEPETEEPFIDNISFVFSDIDTEPGQVFILDLSARFNYIIKKLAVETDSGYIDFTVDINYAPITGLVSETAFDMVSDHVATAFNMVKTGNLVRLYITGITDTPSTLSGNMLIQRN